MIKYPIFDIVIKYPILKFALLLFFYHYQSDDIVDDDDRWINKIDTKRQKENDKLITTVILHLAANKTQLQHLMQHLEAGKALIFRLQAT